MQHPSLPPSLPHTHTRAGVAGSAYTILSSLSKDSLSAAVQIFAYQRRAYQYPSSYGRGQETENSILGTT